MKRLDLTMALAAAALTGLIAGGAAAQTAEPAAPAAAAPAEAPAKAAKPAAKPAKKKAAATSGSTIAVSVWNSRTSDLAELQVAPSGSDDFKKALGALKAGKKAGAKVPKTKDCLIDLHATFADGQTTDASGVDVCKQKILNLTE